ncbi:MAG: FmdB family transcriptional regulator [Nitrospira bacterium SG8_35_1]|nr:MAG: FmdB family transcriptional regulator [Nitrospira bacterium SG8_35_1]
MPIFEYKCSKCNEEFEKLVYGSSPEVSCPKCMSTDVAKKLSTFGMGGVEKQTSSGCTSCTKSTCSSCS